MPDLVKFILVILAIWVVYQVFTTILFTLSQKQLPNESKAGRCLISSWRICTTL